MKWKTKTENPLPVSRRIVSLNHSCPMQSLPTLPRRSWLERIVLGLAAALVAIGGLTLVGWWLSNDAWIQPVSAMSVLKANAALGILCLGIALLSYELGWKAGMHGTFLAVIVGLLSLLQDMLRVDLHIDQLLVRDHLLIGTKFPGRMPTVVAASLVLSGLTLVWRAFGRKARSRVWAEAMTGSIVGVSGLSSLMGYASSLPEIYTWGSETAVPPIGAVALCILGSASVLSAWRESQQAEKAPPAWAPIPAVVATSGLSIVLWIGLEARERASVSSVTLIMNERYASLIKDSIDKQASYIERISRNWSELPEAAQVAWAADANALLINLGAKGVGCLSINRYGLDRRLLWSSERPDGNPPLSGVDAEREIRKASMDAAESTRAPTISATVPLRGFDGKQAVGFAIFSPVISRGIVVGFVAADYEYLQFFSAIAAKLAGAVGDDFHLSIAIAGATVFTLGSDLNTRDTVIRTHTIATRRIQLSVTPTDATRKRDRRYLPKLALVAGVGITTLIGLSIHLYRVAVVRVSRRDSSLSPNSDATRLITKGSLPGDITGPAEARRPEAQLGSVPVFGGRYRLVQEVGRGGMGVVWRAEDTKLNRTVALKLLSDLLVRDREAMADLAAETRRCLELTHPHVVRVYDLVEEGDRAAITMEFVDGPSLAEHKLVQPDRCFAPESLALWLGQLCSALDYAHRAAHLVHRDLKPLNLLLTGTGNLKVVDFGISRSLGKAETRLSTQARSSGFSLAYAGPQQIMGELPAVTDDIYSFGATVYELLTGKTPFYDGDLLAQIREVVPPSMSHRRAMLGVTNLGRIPDVWETTVAACLAKKSTDRPQNIAEVAGHLGIALG